MVGYIGWGQMCCSDVQCLYFRQWLLLLSMEFYYLMLLSALWVVSFLLYIFLDRQQKYLVQLVLVRTSFIALSGRSSYCDPLIWFDISDGKVQEVVDDIYWKAREFYRQENIMSQYCPKANSNLPSNLHWPSSRWDEKFSSHTLIQLNIH